MANVKSVKIETNLNVMGVMNTAAGCEASCLGLATEMQRYQNIPKENVEKAIAASRVIRNFMAQAMVPYFGLKMRFTGSEIVETNKAGGRVFYLRCFIEGEEAVSWEYIKGLKDALRPWSHEGQVS